MDTDRKPFFSRKVLIAVLAIIGLSIVIGVLVTTSGIPGFKEKTPMPSTNGVDITGTGDDKTGQDYGIKVGLSGGQLQQTTPVPMPVATGEPLTPEEIDTLFSRLPNLPVGPNEQTDFKFPVELLPPPKTGVIIKDKFPYSEYLPTPEVISQSTFASTAVCPGRGNLDRSVYFSYLQPRDGPARDSHRPG